MKSIIEQIFCRQEPMYESIPRSEEYLKREREYDSIHTKIEDTLNEEQKQLLDDLWLAGVVLTSEANLTYFKEGVKFGLLLAMEAHE